MSTIVSPNAKSKPTSAPSRASVTGSERPDKGVIVTQRFRGPEYTWWNMRGVYRAIRNYLNDWFPYPMDCMEALHGKRWEHED